MSGRVFGAGRFFARVDKPTDHVMIRSIDFGLLILVSFSVVVPEVLNETQNVVLGLYEKSNYAFCFPIGNTYDMSSYVAKVMNALMHTGIPNLIHLHDCSAEQSAEVSLYDQCYNLKKQYTKSHFDLIFSKSYLTGRVYFQNDV